jgi:N-acetyl-gamma-glutamyl-phosphate reductase
MESRISVGVVGASGYSGALCARLVARHPRMRLAFLTSDAKRGERARGAAIDADLSFIANADASRAAETERCDAILLATPAEASATLVPEIRERLPKSVIVDLSGAFRLADAAAVSKWYGLEHRAPGLLAKAHYGVPEIFGAPPSGALIANPGCYPTSSLLALAPLLKADAIDRTTIIIDAKSGTTGAGRQTKEAYSFSEIDENAFAYKIHAHQHEPEIARHLARAANADEGSLDVTFTAHLLPVRRGILATCYAKARAADMDVKYMHSIFTKAYENSRFVRVVLPERVSLAAVVGTNEAHVGVSVSRGKVIVMSAIDNLLKGAAGQAIQNVNLAFGFEEDLGLTLLERSAA